MNVFFLGNSHLLFILGRGCGGNPLNSKAKKETHSYIPWECYLTDKHLYSRKHGQEISKERCPEEVEEGKLTSDEIINNKKLKIQLKQQQ